MTPTIRKRILIGLGGIVGLLIVAVLAAPMIIDVNSYKSTIVAEVKRITGRDLVLGGPIELSLLPTPTVSVAGVRFSNEAGSSNPDMVEVKSITVRPSLLALLRGDFQVDEVALIEPRIVLAINAEGRPNWDFAPSATEAKPAASNPASSANVSVGRLTIDNGTLVFSDARTGLSLVAEKANLSASLGSLEGPYSVAGSAHINGAPVELDLAVSAKGTNGHNADMSLQAGGGKLALKGTLNELGANAKLTGTMSVAAESFTGFVGTLLKLAGQPQPGLPPLLAGKFSFDGGIEVSRTAIAARDFRLVLGQDSGSGTLAVTLRPALAVEGKIVVPKLDLDTWMAAVRRADPVGTEPASPKPGSRPATPAAGPSMLSDVTANLAFEIGEAIYNQKAVRNIVLELNARAGAVAVPRLSATLPGDMILQAKSTMTGGAGTPKVSGEFSLVGPKLRETLAWLEIDVSALPSTKLQKLSMRGRMTSSDGKVQVSDAVFELDDLKGTGGIAVTFSVPMSIVTTVNVDTLDLDTFLVPASAQRPATPPVPAHPGKAGPQPAVAGPSIGLKGRVDKLVYNKETIGGVDMDVALQGATLRLNDVKVANLAGGRLAVRGTVGDYAAPQRRFDLAFNFAAPDLGRVLKVAGVAAPGIGAVSASGGVAGTLEQLSLRELVIDALGQSAKATGTLALPGASRGALQSAAWRGNVVLNGQAIEGSVDAKLAGKPVVNADLRANVLDLDKVASGNGGARAPARGRPTTAKAIDMSPLRSVDGSFKIAAGTLISAPLRIGNADVAATLKDGVLTVQHFKGALYGGSLTLAGVVNASQPALSFDFKGDANSIYVGEMLRGMSGSNQFGSAVKVTIDGKLNANGLSVRGAGTTSDQIRASIAGGARLSGHVFVGADRALQMLGGAAAGAASGAINQALGNVLGSLGQQAGAGVGNILNAVALVLNRFVNHDSPIAGQIDVAGGVLTDKGLTVQGNRATARISTRTNLGNSTTDTTINFMLAEDPSAPYLITTARGAISSPSLNVVRGTAKDPPGMASTLPGAQAPPAGQPGQQTPRRSLIPNIPIPNPFSR